MTTVLAVMSMLIGASSTLALAALLWPGGRGQGAEASVARRVVGVSAGVAMVSLCAAGWVWWSGYPWGACVAGALPLVVNGLLLGVLVRLEW